tara:strand:+ start:40 stop:585 length:546 start_codon:yes stop_codon:yes gene_type:complete
MDDRTGRPEQIMAPALRSIIKRIDLAIENGSLDPKDRDEVIKMFISGPTTVVDNKRGGGMMNMDEMIRPLGMRQGGDPVQERMLMLRDSMRDDENQRMREPDVTSVALTIAKQQGDTSEDNINMIIRQLMAMVPSVNKTAKDELTPTMNKGIQSLLNKISVMMGKKSDPQLNRNVGFERVE